MCSSSCRADHLKLEPDHVLADMLRQMHLIVSEEQAAFEPEAGAYAAQHAHGHHEHGHSAARSRSRAQPLMAAEPTAAMSPDTLLRLMWLASPALPVGGFSYSEGLESAVEAGIRERTRAQAGGWLLDQLHLSLARAELAGHARRRSPPGSDHDCAACRGAQRLGRGRPRESAELRQQTEQMGRSLLEWLRNAPSGDDARIAQLAALAPAPTWPVAFALAAALTGAPAPAKRCSRSHSAGPRTWCRRR